LTQLLYIIWKLFKHGLGSQLLRLGCPVTKPAMGHYVTCTQKWWDKFNSVLFALWALLIALMKWFMCFPSCHSHLCSIQNMQFWSHACQVCHPQAPP